MSAPNDIGKYDRLASKQSNFRRISAQVIAAAVENVHSIDSGMAEAFPTILIPALTGLPNEQNRNEFLTMNGSEASWIGSIGSLSQIFGTLTSGLMTDRFGRKRALMIVNIPFALAWLLLYQANEVWHIFFAFAMLGLGIGLLEASLFTYLGEICEPSCRAFLVACTNNIFSLGLFLVYILNAWLPWRTLVLVCLTVPVTSAISLCFIPETPQWLLSKNRTKQAQKSLRWLRGWTTEQAVSHEFYELKRHSERSNSCNSCIKQNQQCIHPLPTLAEKCAELKRKRTLKPFAIVVSLFFLSQFTGGYATRPFMVQILKAYDSPIPSDQGMMTFGVVENLANVIFTCLVRFTGKRRLYLTMAFGIFLSALIASCYGFIYLPSGYNSFDRSNQSFHLENPNLAYIPTICLYVWNCCTMCGFSSMPFMFLSELFPLKARVLCCSIAASLNYVFGFISKKTYYNLETTLSLPGVTMFYCVIAGFGLILTYYILPETECRTLEDIEVHFSDNSKKLTDRIIKKLKTDPHGKLSNQELLFELKGIQVATE